MTQEKPKPARRVSDVPEPPSRTASHLRVRSVQRRSEPDFPGVSAPSTLPPPPFQHEASVVALEWWLDAHMALASQLLWVRQMLDGVPSAGPHGEAVRQLIDLTENVRDALYELYCDAADDRMSRLVGRGAALELHVRGSYAWCVRVVGLLATVTSGLRTVAGPDWAAAKRGFQQASARYPAPPGSLRDAVRSLPLDFASPIEPLRNLPQDLEQLFTAMGELHDGLAKRLG